MNIAARYVGDAGTKAAALSFENIRHGYGHGDVLNNISLTARPGEVLCLLGPSGSGKSTLLRIAAGLEVPRSGRLLINDQTVAGPGIFVTPEKRGIGLMFQDFALFPHMTVAANVAFGLSGIPKSEKRLLAEDGLSRVGLSGYGAKYPHMLSGGEQQRVALARAVAPRPSVLLMDEPFSGLDSRLKDQVRADTLAILRETGATVVIVTHDPEEAMGMADQIALLKAGTLVQVGSPRQLFSMPKSLFAASFFSAINVLDGVCKDGKLVTPLGIRPAPVGCGEGAVSVAIRLAGVKLSASSAAHAVAAEIRARRYLGTSEHLDLQIAGTAHHIQARVSAGTIDENAMSVFIDVPDDAILVFEKQV